MLMCKEYLTFCFRSFKSTMFRVRAILLRCRSDSFGKVSFVLIRCLCHRKLNLEHLLGNRTANQITPLRSNNWIRNQIQYNLSRNTIILHGPSQRFYSLSYLALRQIFAPHWSIFCRYAIHSQIGKKRRAGTIVSWALIFTKESYNCWYNGRLLYVLI